MVEKDQPSLWLSGLVLQSVQKCCWACLDENHHHCWPPAWTCNLSELGLPATSAWCFLCCRGVPGFSLHGCPWECRPGWAESSHISRPEGCISSCQQWVHLCSHIGFTVATYSLVLNYSDIHCALCNIAAYRLSRVFTVYLISLGGCCLKNLPVDVHETCLDMQILPPQARSWFVFSCAYCASIVACKQAPA